MKLGERQEQFASMLPGLINEALRLGYRVRIGDVFRDPRAHGDFGVLKGYAAANSVHKLKLAVDLNLVLDGKLNSAGHKLLHDYWDKVGGAERILGDMCHYSLNWEGYR